MSGVRTNHIKTAMVNDSTFYVCNTVAKVFHCTSSESSISMRDILKEVKRGHGIPFKKLPWKEYTSLKVQENYLVVG